MGLAARAVARRRAEVALSAGFHEVRLVDLDDLLSVDPEIEHTRFHWFRSAPDSPSGDSLIGLMERLAFIRSLEIDPHLSESDSSGTLEPDGSGRRRYTGLACRRFNVARRRATIVTQLSKLSQKLIDDAVTMFCKLIGRCFLRQTTGKSLAAPTRIMKRQRRSGCFATRCVLSSPPTKPGRMRWTAEPCSTCVRNAASFPMTCSRMFSPLSWEHINLTGIYTWDEPPSFAESCFRPLRTSTAIAQAA